MRKSSKNAATLMAVAILALLATSCDRTRVVTKEKIVEREKRVEVPVADTDATKAANQVTVTLWDEGEEKALASLEAHITARESASAALKAITDNPNAMILDGQLESLHTKIADAEKAIDDQLKILDVAKADDITRTALEIDAIKASAGTDSQSAISVFDRHQSMRMATLVARRDRMDRLAQDLKDKVAAVEKDAKLNLRSEAVAVFSDTLDAPKDAIEKVLSFKVAK